MPRVNANPITEKEALDYILEKENRPTHEKSREIALTWDSEAKTRAFFSARVAKADILEGMRKHITDVVQGRGTTSDAEFWIRRFLRTDGASSLKELGFMSEYDARESESIMELASHRRLTLIIEQNVRMAHAVGEYAEFMDARDSFPYVEYRTRGDEKVRNTHTLLDGMIFKVDDPIMSRICPPQDFRCRCRLRQLKADELGGRQASGELPEGWKPPESGFSFDVTKGLAQALPEKEQWGDDIKEEFRKEVQNPPAAVKTAPAPVAPINPPEIKDVLEKDIESALKINTKGIPFEKNKNEGLMLSVDDVVSIATKEKNTHVWTDYSLISDNYAEKVKKETRKDIQGYKRSLASDEVRKILKKHSTDPIPIKPEDFSKLSAFAEKADRVITSIRKGKLERLISICPELFGFVIMVEEIRTGRKKLALKSLYNTPEKEIDKVIRTLRVTS